VDDNDDNDHSIAEDMVYHFKYLAKDDKDEEQFDLIVGEWNFDA
jgi:hypothetical protein